MCIISFSPLSVNTTVLCCNINILHPSTPPPPTVITEFNLFMLSHYSLTSLRHSLVRCIISRLMWVPHIKCAIYAISMVRGQGTNVVVLMRSDCKHVRQRHVVLSLNHLTLPFLMKAHNGSCLHGMHGLHFKSVMSRGIGTY